MAVNLSPYGGVGAQFLDNAGNVLTGGKIETYAAGTTVPQATYTDATGTTFHPNPIILDASGRVPSGGEIWLTDGLLYKFVLRDSNNVLIATYDNIAGINSNFVNFTNQQEIQTATAGQTVFNLATTQYQPNTNSLSVFVDGVNQYGPGAQYAYLETDSDTVTFVNGLHVGALVKFTTSQLNSSTGGDAFSISYLPPFTNATGTNVGNKLAQTISVLDFGAVGDGVTDDYTAISNALTAAVGKQLIFPSGYVFASGTRISVPSNSYLTGGGTIKALPLGTSASIEGFLFGATLTNVTIDDITIDSNPSVQTHPLLASVFFTASTDINIVNNKVICSYSGVYVRSNSNNVNISNNNIDNSFGSTTDAALRHNPSIIAGANNAIVANNIVKGVLSTAVADSLIATGITVGADGSANTYRNITVTGNTVQNTYTAIAGSDVVNVSITGNTLSDCRTANHSQAVLLTRCVSASVVGNSCFNVDYTAIAFVNCSNSTIAGNTIENSSTFLVGAGLDPQFNGITSSVGDSNVITGNTIVVDGATAGIAGRGVISAGNNCVISDNTIQTKNIEFSQGIQFYGSYCKVIGNTIRVNNIGIRVLLVSGTVTQYNTIESNTVEVAGSISTNNNVLDQSEGPNRYANNFYTNSNNIGATFTNNQYFSRDNGKDTLLSKTADYTVALEDTYKQINNGGATGTVVFSLPDATSSGTNRPFGLVYKFYRLANQIVRIDPFGTNVIRGGNAGKYLQLDNNSAVELVMMSSGAWEIVNSHGTYTFEP
jgi:parallel beta-helix repeat protein